MRVRLDGRNGTTCFHVFGNLDRVDSTVERNALIAVIDDTDARNGQNSE